jgi:hypothetical protein
VSIVWLASCLSPSIQSKISHDSQVAFHRSDSNLLRKIRPFDEEL